MMIIGIDPFIVYGAIAVCLIFLLRRRLWLPSRYGRWFGYALLAIVAHALIGNRAHMREFRSILRDVRKLRDWMAEQDGFELQDDLPRSLKIM